MVRLYYVQMVSSPYVPCRKAGARPFHVCIIQRPCLCQTLLGFRYVQGVRLQSGSKIPLMPAALSFVMTMRQLSGQIL